MSPSQARFFNALFASIGAVVDDLPEFSAKEINWAADVFRNPGDVNDFEAAIAVVSAWRTAHELPVSHMYDALTVAAKTIDPDCVVASRLKRLPTIINKCSRQPKLPLWKMQDIGGLRVILNSTSDAYKLNALLESSPPDGFKFERCKDYIADPKKTGYRSFHRMYADDSGNERTNGLHIEVQIRSRLQHAWATANEVVGMFLGQDLKSGLGDPHWLRFFTVAGSIIARAEGGKIGDNVPQDDASLTAELDALENRLRAFNKITGYTVVHLPTVSTFAPHYGAGFFVVTLDVASRKVHTRVYSEDEFAQAVNDYIESESQSLDNPDIDVVFVFLEEAKQLEEAYPNYFADTGEFLHALYPDWQERIAQGRL
jgi:ppGpp synthetase/RelA/SpoT-type nucleotidyltranferase